jgi:shikimate kinase
LKWFKEKKKFVLATGGGTPCFQNNMDWMKKEGVVIWLDESIEVLLTRLKPEQAQRPLIAGMDEKTLSQFLQNKILERTPFYQQAHYRLQHGEISDAAIKKIIQQHAS